MRKILLNRNIYSFTAVFLLWGLCILIYYFGEIVNFAGWEALRWEFFYGVHDTQRLLYLAPIIYAGYVFGFRAMVMLTILSAGSMAFRALYISPFPDPLLRPAIFCVVAGAIGHIVVSARYGTEIHQILEALYRSERDNLLDTLNRMEDGVLITGPDYRVRYTNPAMVLEFDQGVGSNCYEYLYNLDKPCNQTCKLVNVVNGTAEKWECKFPDGRTYEVLASPHVDTDGVVCQLAIFRNTTKHNKAAVDCRRPDDQESRENDYASSQGFPAALEF